MHHSALPNYQQLNYNFFSPQLGVLHRYRLQARGAFRFVGNNPPDSGLGPGRSIAFENFGGEKGSLPVQPTNFVFSLHLRGEMGKELSSR